MAEETKGIRLKKAATELNVGISTLVEYLAKKGHQVETNPNTRLTAEQYDIVAAAFQSERAVKEQADKIEITPSGNNMVIEANTEEKTEESEEVIIKNYNSSAIENKGTAQPVATAVTPDEPTEPEPVETPQPEEPAPQPAEEPAPEPQKVEAEVSEEPAAEAQPSEAPAEEPAPVEEPQTLVSTPVGDLRIIKKIDLDAINSKMRRSPTGVETKV